MSNFFVFSFINIFFLIQFLFSFFLYKYLQISEKNLTQSFHKILSKFCFTINRLRGAVFFLFEKKIEKEMKLGTTLRYISDRKQFFFSSFSPLVSYFLHFHFYIYIIFGYKNTPIILYLIIFIFLCVPGLIKFLKFEKTLKHYGQSYLTSLLIN